MTYSFAQVPYGTQYYDIAAGAVKQSAEHWHIMEDTLNKTWAIYPDAPDIPASATWRTYPNTSGWLRVGVSLLVAQLLVRALNNPT